MNSSVPGAPTPQPEPQPQTKLPEAVNIRNLVKDGLINANCEVRTRIVTVLVEEEVARRTKATQSVLEKVEATQLEIRKVRPTPTGFNATGQPIGEPVFTKEQVESLKKLNEQLGKLNNALEKALNDSDFTKVFELSGGKKE